MKKILISFFITIIFLNVSKASDVTMATSEDLKEFDKILSQEDKNPRLANPSQKPVDQNQNSPPDHKKDRNNPRDQFQNGNGPTQRNGPPQNPFNQRPPPGAMPPGGNQLPPPPGGNPPPPPPPN